MGCVTDSERTTTFNQLSQRQRDVLSLIAFRKTTKEIATDLRVSQTRIDQHIRALKDAIGVETLAQLAEFFHSLEHTKSPLGISTLGTSQVVHPTFPTHQSPRVEADRVVFEDAGAHDASALWSFEREPQVVPEALDGDWAVLRRLAFIVAVAIAIPVAGIVIISATAELSNLLWAAG